MKSNKLIWLAALVLAAAPAVNLAAQEGPGGEETEEIEVWEGGPGGGPGMGKPGGPGKGMMAGKGAKRMMWIEKEEGGEEMEEGQGRMTVKVRKIREGGMGMGMGQGRFFMSDEDTLAVVKKHDPAFANKLAEFKGAAPAKYKMALAMIGKALGGAKGQEDEALEKDVVRGAALEFEVKELSRKLDKASEGEKAKIKESMKGKLSEIFDLRTKGQEHRVKRMEGDLAKIKANLEKRKANKAKIVDQRLEQLTGEGYGW